MLDNTESHMAFANETSDPGFTAVNHDDFTRPELHALTRFNRTVLEIRSKFPETADILPRGTIHKVSSSVSKEARWKVLENGITGATFIFGDLDTLFTRKLQTMETRFGTFFAARERQAILTITSASLVTPHA